MFISIITPVKDGENYISDCIESVAEQEIDMLEHIIIDGDSSDSTKDIIRKAAEKYSHIRWISEPDGGQSEAMNKGIRMARGTWIGVLNHDDYYESGILSKIQRWSEGLRNPSMIVGNCRIVSHNGSVIQICRPKKMQLHDLLLGDKINVYPVNPNSYFYHRTLHDAAGYFDESDHYAMDLDFLLRAVQSADILYKDELFGTFRKYPGTKTHGQSRGNAGAVTVCRMMDRYTAELPFFSRIKVRVIRRFLYGPRADR